MAVKISNEQKKEFTWATGDITIARALVFNEKLTKLQIRNKKGSPGLITISDEDFLFFVWDCLSEVVKHTKRPSEHKPLKPVENSQVK